MIEHVHPVALPIVGFDPPVPLDLLHLSRATSPDPRLAVPLLPRRFLLLNISGGIERNLAVGSLPSDRVLDKTELGHGEDDDPGG